MTSSNFLYPVQPTALVAWTGGPKRGRPIKMQLGIATAGKATYNITLFHSFNVANRMDTWPVTTINYQRVISVGRVSVDSRLRTRSESRHSRGPGFSTSRRLTLEKLPSSPLSADSLPPKTVTQRQTSSAFLSGSKNISDQSFADLLNFLRWQKLVTLVNKDKSRSNRRNGVTDRFFGVFAELHANRE